MNGVHLERGFTTPDPEEVMVKRLAIRNAQDSYVLLDHTKFNKQTFVSVAPLQDATIITERCPLEFLDDYSERTTIKEANQ